MKGFGDLALSVYLARPHSRRFAYGLGSSVLFPSAPSKYLGRKKLAIGPAAVVMYKPNWGRIGLFARNIWSVAGDDERKDINRLNLQPSLRYRFSPKWFLISNPNIVANWKEERENRWLVPVGGGLGTTGLGAKKSSISAQFYYFIERPTNGVKWMLEFKYAFLHSNSIK